MASGDFDLLFSLYRFYLSILPLSLQRNKIYFNHTGAFFPETLTMFGMYTNGGYGYDCPNQRGNLPFNTAGNTYIRYYVQGGIELCMIMLDHFSYNEDLNMVKEYLVPIAEAVTEHYYYHFPQRDNDGKMVFFPSQSLETWQCPNLSECVTNPLPDIAGLWTILPRLLKLPTTGIFYFYFFFFF